MSNTTNTEYQSGYDDGVTDARRQAVNGVIEDSRVSRDRPRGLARLDTYGLTELRRIVQLVIMEGDLDNGLPWRLYKADAGTIGKRDQQRNDFWLAIERKIVNAAAPAIAAGARPQNWESK